MDTHRGQWPPKVVEKSGSDLLVDSDSSITVPDRLLARRAFFLSCVLCAWLLIVEVLSDTVGMTSLAYWLLRFVPYCLFLVLLAYYARSVVRVDKKTLFMALFLFSFFLTMLVGLAGHTQYFAGVPMLRPESTARESIFSYLRLISMFSFLAGSYFALQEIYQTRSQLCEEVERQRKAEQALKRQLGFDKLISELLGRLAWSSGEEVDTRIQTGLKQIAEFMGVEQAFVVLVSPDFSSWSITHEWHAAGIPNLVEKYQNIAMGGFSAWAEERLAEGEVVQISRMDDYPLEASSIRKRAESEGVKSSVIVPLTGQGKVLIGCIGLRSYMHERRWSHEDIRKLRLLAESFVNVIKRKRAEEALRISEARERQLNERFNLAADSAGIGIWDLDIVHNALVWDERMYRLYQVSPQAFSGAYEAWQKVVHPLDLPRAQEEVQQAIRNLQPFETDFRIVWPSGEIRHIKAFARVIRDEHGFPARMTGINYDITERKRAEEALRESEERFRATFENAGIGIALVDMQGHPIKSNPALERMLGYSREELSGMTFKEFTYPDDLELDLNLFDELVSGKLDKYEIEKRYIKKDGQMMWGCLTVSLIRAPEGVPRYAIGMAEDITEHKRAVEALRLSEERFAKAFQASPEPISIYRHRDGTLLEINERWTSTYGYTREEAIGRTSVQLNLVPPEERQKLRGLLEEEGSVREYEIDLRNKQGDIRHVSLSAEHIMIHDEPCDIFLHRDITERKRAEKQLKAISEQLRALTASVTSAREEEGIRIAREIHDELGSALTSLRWDLEGIDRIIAELEESRLRKVREKIASMLRLTDTTIGVVRRISSELRPSVLDDLGLREAIEWQAQQFQAQRGIVCHCDCTAECLALSQGQSTAVFRIFQEALTNILRHAEATRVEIGMEEEDGEFILTIADNGKGISTDQKSGLHSLGILGMRERAHLVGGHIDITGSEGKGTVVTVRMPQRA